MSSRPDALKLAARALARRDLTSAELAERLERAGVSAEARAEVVERLRNAGYVDDLRAAGERAHRLAERGQGDAAIRFDLGRRGIAPELIDEATASLEPEHVRARRLARSLGGGGRAARALARKGFAADAIDHAVGAVADEC